MDWKSYENITKEIYKAIGKKSDIEIIGSGKDCKVQGKSGVKHQIDVLTQHSDGIHSYKTAIECKYWNDNVNKDIVMKVSEIIEDAGIDKGVIVSKNGFTPDGISFAKYKNIGLVQLKEVSNNSDFGIFDVKSGIRSPRVLKIGIDNINSQKKGFEEINPSDLLIRTPMNIEVPLNDFIKNFKEELKKGKPAVVIKKKHDLNGAFIVNKKLNEVTEIRSISLEGILIEQEWNLNFQQVDKVWMVMKSIFEEKEFSIMTNGEIKENK